MPTGPERHGGLERTQGTTTVAGGHGGAPPGQEPLQNPQEIVDLDQVSQIGGVPRTMSSLHAVVNTPSRSVVLLAVVDVGLVAAGGSGGGDIGGDCSVSGGVGSSGLVGDVGGW